MLEERENKMQTEAIPSALSDFNLIIEKLIIKNEYADNNIIQLSGKLVCQQASSDKIVIALHAKDQAGQYIHLQQYEFEYCVDRMLEKDIDISVVVLSEINAEQSYEIEVKLLAEQTNQQWQTIQSHLLRV